jgi:[ribosomal protein S5]-alanine N-acetyltransferase
MIAFETYRMPEMRSARLVLEPLSPWHADAMFDVLRDPALYTYISDEKPQGPGALAKWCSRHQTPLSPDGTELWLNWAVRLIGNGYAGYVQASVRPDGVAEIAYVFGSRFWGQGHGREAAARLLAHVFDDIGAEAARALIDTRNAPSRRLVAALGFNEIAIHAKTEQVRGRWIDDAEYRLERDTWRRSMA